MSPPIIARALLRWLTSSDSGAELVEEVNGEYRQLRERVGRLRADVWYWRQLLHPDVVRLAIHLRAWHGRGSRRPADVLRGSFAHLRQSLRCLTREPLSAWSVVITLGVGIGGATSTFALLDALLLAPLPYPEPHRLVSVWVELPEASRVRFSGPGAADFVEGVDEIEAGRVYGSGGPSALDFGNGPESFVGVGVGPETLDLYHVRPLLGRTFRPEDKVGLDASQMRDPELVRPAGAAVISHRLWTRRLGADSSVIGRTVLHDGHPRVILGVMPAGFRVLRPDDLGGASDEDFWFLPFWDQTLFPRVGSFVGMVGRLAPGVSPQMAQDVIDRFAAAQREMHPEERARDFRLSFEPLDAGFAVDEKRFVTVLFGAVLLLLLIASANVANLMLARSAARRPEWLVRKALGASRATMVRDSLTEVLVLAGAGALLGTGFARVAVVGLVEMSPASVPGMEGSVGDVRVLLFSIVVTAFTVLLAGMAPALHVQALDPAQGLGSRGADDATWQSLYRSGLVVAQVALALVLLSGTALLARSLRSMLRVDTGFDPVGVVKMEVVPSSKYYPTPRARVDFLRELHAGFTEIAGVTGVGGANPLPFGSIQEAPVEVRTAAGAVRELRAGLRQWLPGTAEMLSMRLLAGRYLDWADMTDLDALKALVDARFAEAAWPGHDPLGRAVRVERRDYGPDGQIRMQPYWAEVVGVVEPIRGVSLSKPDPPTVFVTFHQNPWATVDFGVRTMGDPKETLESMKALVTRTNPNIPTRGEVGMEDDIASSLDRLRFGATLIGVFATVSAFLALFGIFALVSHDVGRRRGEIGIRMALGATPARVRRTVLSRAGQATLLGVLVGIPLAVVLAGAFASTLHGTEPTDPTAYVFGGLALCICGLLAAYVPARAASRLDPSSTLAGR